MKVFAASRPRIIVHIGDHKTGTTSIQDALAAGRITLPGRRLLYPLGRTADHNYLCRQEDGRPRLIREDRPAGPGLDRIAAEVDRSRLDVCILSAEQLERSCPEETVRILTDCFGKDADLQLVAYVRPHPGRLLSNFVEMIKIGWFDDTLDAYAEERIKRGTFQYLPRFRKWRALLGDRFHLRPFVRDRLKGGVVEDFLTTALGSGASWRLEPGANRNESMSLEDLMVVRELHRILQMPRLFSHAFGWEALRAAAGVADSGTKVRLHRALAERIAKTYREDARAMDRAFFGGEAVLEPELDAAVAGACDTPQISGGAFFGPDEQRRIELVGRLIRDMLPNKARPWPEFWRERAARESRSELIPRPGRVSSPYR